jgi:hypothetical protein
MVKEGSGTTDPTEVSTALRLRIAALVTVAALAGIVVWQVTRAVLRSQHEPTAAAHYRTGEDLAYDAARASLGLLVFSLLTPILIRVSMGRGPRPRVVIRVLRIWLGGLAGFLVGWCAINWEYRTLGFIMGEFAYLFILIPYLLMIFPLAGAFWGAFLGTLWSATSLERMQTGGPAIQSDT